MQANQTDTKNETDKKHEEQLISWDCTGEGPRGDTDRRPQNIDPFDFFGISSSDTSLLLQPPVAPLTPRKYEKDKLKKTFEAFKVASNKHHLSLKEKAAL